MKDNRFISRILAGAEFHLIDVGAAYGLLPHLAVLESAAKIVLFEPDAQSAAMLEEQYSASISKGMTRVVRSALSGAGGKRALHVTNVSTGSSLLKPGSEAAREYVDPGYLYPLREIEIETQTLANALDQLAIPAPSLIKLDVQGAELEILKGLGGAKLARTLGVELEIGMPGGYLEQPQFTDVQTFLGASGFELFDLRAAHAYRPKSGKASHYQTEVFSVCANSPTVSARLWELDAVYFRSARSVLNSRDTLELRRLIVAYCTYNFFSEAYWLVEQAEQQGAFSPSDAQALKRGIVEWHGSFERLFLYRNNWLASGLRWILFRLAPRNSPRWCKYMWQDYP
jgi:FkbM family methyltransferase